MKIGIITYHDSRNYGAVLQAYALQKVIENLNQECEIIDYKCSTITNRYKIKKISQLSNFKEIIKYMLGNNSAKKTQIKFDYFKSNFQSISKKSYDKNNIIETNNIYDKFITGSDQVWNLNLSGEDYTYMLDFVSDNSKKNSYAASFGYERIPNEFLDKTKHLLSNFNNISVRELQGHRIINNILEKESEVVLDPTLLLNKKEWNEISHYKKRKKEYILLYLIALTPSIISFTKKLAKEKGCEIIYINNSYKYKMGMTNIKNVGPEEFIGYLQNAKYIVTSSFHGLVFSINFEKNFFFELSISKNNFNSRLENIVDKLDLRERQIINGENNFTDKDIDYSLVNKILDKEIKKSKEFIKKIIGENNE